MEHELSGVSRVRGMLGRRSVRFGVPAAILAAILAGVLGLTQKRVEAVTCSLSSTSRLLVASVAESQIKISRDASGADPLIRVNDVPCGTLRTIDSIESQGSTGTEILIIDQTNGRFVDPGNGSEILFTGDLGPTGDPDTLSIIGRGSADDITFGQDGPTYNGTTRGTLNKDASTEISIAGLDALTGDLRAGADRFSGSGTNGTSLALNPTQLPISVHIKGGSWSGLSYQIGK